MPDFPDPDEQDVAETLDETNLTRDGYDIANFDEIPDVLDVTAAAGDADEDEPKAEYDEDEDFRPDETVDAAPITGLEDRPDRDLAGDGADAHSVDAEDRVTTEDRQKPSRFESKRLSDEQLDQLGYKR